MADQEFHGQIGRTYDESEPWWPEGTRAPEDAPNVLMVVLDDVGFGQLGCYGGLVEMKWGPMPVVEQGETICVVSDHFRTEEHVVEAPFDGFLAGILANPRVLPGHPLVHLVEFDDADREHVRQAYRDVGFARHGIFHWMGRMGERMAESALDGQPSGASDGD